MMLRRKKKKKYIYIYIFMQAASMQSIALESAPLLDAILLPTYSAAAYFIFLIVTLPLVFHLTDADLIRERSSFMLT